MTPFYTEEELLEELFKKETFNKYLSEWAKSCRVLLSFSYVDNCTLEDLKLLSKISDKMSVRLKAAITLKEEELGCEDKTLMELYERMSDIKEEFEVK